MSHPDPSTRAIFQSLVLAALADGTIVRSEAEVVEALLKLDARFAAVTDAFELAVATRVLLDSKGIEEALEHIVAPIKTAPDRALTFRMCARVIIADGKTEGDEAMVLGSLQELFSLSLAEVKEALDEERARKAAQP